MTKYGWNRECIFQEIEKNVHFWYIIDHKVFRSSSAALICMPESLLREINQYWEVWLEFG